MTFEINFNSKIYSYDLGTSEEAIKACEGLARYNATHKYEDLKHIFAHLAWIVSKGNPLNKKACLATQVLALSVFPLLNEYQKCFLAVSVTSIYKNAKYPIPKDWIIAFNKYAAFVKKNYNAVRAQEAGLSLLKTVEEVVPPTSEHKA